MTKELEATREWSKEFAISKDDIKSLSRVQPSLGPYVAEGHSVFGGIGRLVIGGEDGFIGGGSSDIGGGSSSLRCDGWEDSPLDGGEDFVEQDEGYIEQDEGFISAEGHRDEGRRRDSEGQGSGIVAEGHRRDSEGAGEGIERDVAGGYNIKELVIFAAMKANEGHTEEGMIVKPGDSGPAIGPHWAEGHTPRNLVTPAQYPE